MVARMNYIGRSQDLLKMSETNPLQLGVNDPNSIERFLIVMAIGTLHSIENQSLSVAHAHVHLFNPYIWGVIKDVGVSSDLAEIWHKALFLEDVEAHFPDEALEQDIQELKQALLDMLQTSQFDRSVKNRWLRKDDSP